MFPFPYTKPTLLLLVAAFAIFNICPAVPAIGADAKEIFTRGMQAFTSARSDEAITLFKEAIEADPLYMEAYKALFFILDKMGRHKEILEYGRKAIKECVDLDITEKAYLYFRVAKSLQADGELLDAIEAAKKARELDDKREDYPKLLIELEGEKKKKAEQILASCARLIESGEFDKALSETQEAMRLDPGNPEARRLFSKAQEAVRSIKLADEASGLKAKILASLRGGDNDAALATVMSALESQPDNPDFQALRERVEGEIAAVEKAKLDEIKRREDEVKLKNQLEYHTLMGSKHLEAENYEEALKSFEIVLEIDPGNSSISEKKKIAQKGLDLNADIKKGRDLFSEGRFEEAADRFRAALRQVPTSRSICGLLAKCYEELLKLDLAVQVYRSFLQDNPTAWELYEKVGSLSLEMDKFDDAIAAFKKYLDKDPTSAEIVIRLGDVHIRKGEAIDAVKILQDFNNRKPGDIKILEKLAEAFEKSGNADEAVNTLRSMLQHDSSIENEVNVFYKMGCLYTKLEKYNEALERFYQVEKSQANYLDTPERIRSLMWKKYMPILKFMGALLLLAFIKLLITVVSPFFEGGGGSKKTKLIDSGKALMRQGKLDKGIAALEAVVAKHSLTPAESKEVFFQLASGCLKQKKFDKSVMYSEKVIDLDRRFAKAYYVCADALLQMGNAEKAIMQCRYALDIDPGNEAIHSIFQKAYLEAGKLEELLLEYDELAHGNPNNMPLRNIILKLKKEHNAQ